METKFKVGDRIKCVKCNAVPILINRTGTIKNINDNSFSTQPITVEYDEKFIPAWDCHGETDENHGRCMGLDEIELCNKSTTKFKVGDKVKIPKIKSFGSSIKSSSAIKNANRINQKYLFIKEIEETYIIVGCVKNNGCCLFLPSDLELYTEEETVKEFKKGEYIVITMSDSSGSEYKINNIYKQRCKGTYLLSELDSRGIKTNGYQKFEREDNSNWRYGTQKEIDEYEKRGKPYDVTELNNKPGGKFEIGDRVIGIGCSDGKQIDGKIGMVVRIISTNRFGIEFNENINGHSCCGCGINDHCWDVPPKDIKHYNKSNISGTDSYALKTDINTHKQVLGSVNIQRVCVNRDEEDLPVKIDSEEVYIPLEED